MALAEYGRVGIRVIPATGKFREDLKKAMERIERGARFDINVGADMSEAKRSLAVFQKELAAATRDQTAEVKVDVDRSSFARLKSALAALAKGTGAGLGGLAIGGSLMGSTGALASLATQLAAVAGVGVAVPGVLAGAAVAGTAFAMAMKDAGTQLGDLAPQMQELQQSVSAAFWDRAAQPIRDMTTALLPRLKTGLSEIAGELGGWAVAASSALSEIRTMNAITGMFNNIRDAVGTAGEGVGSFTNALTMLSAVGASYLPQLAGLFNEVAYAFEDFVNQGIDDGTFHTWIQNGVSALQELWRVGEGVFGILSGLGSAISIDGAPAGLTVLADALAKVSDVVNSPAFQDAFGGMIEGAMAGMGPLFDGIGQGIQALLPHLPALGDAMGQVLELVGTLSASLGTALGPLLSGLAPILGQVAQALGPVVQQLGAGLGQAFAALMPSLGQAVQALLPVLAQLLVSVAQVLTPIIAAVAPLLPMIIEPIAGAIQALMPAIQAILGLLAPIVQLIVSLLPIFAPILMLIEPIAQLLSAVLTPMLTALTPIIQGIADLLAVTVTPAVTALGQLLSGDFDGAMQTLQQGFADAQELIQGWVDYWVNTFTTVINGIGPWWENVWNSVANFFESIWNKVVFTVSLAKDQLVAWFNKIISDVQTKVDEVVGFVGDIPTKIGEFFNGVGTWLYESGTALIQGFIDGISDMIGSVTSAVGDVVSAAADFFPHSPAKRGPLSGSGYTDHSGRALVEDFGAAIRSRAAAVSSAAGYVAGLASEALAGDVAHAASLARPTAAAPAGAGATVNVYPQPGMDETTIGKSAAREFTWMAGAYT
ncbi:hypothetical protein JRG19_02580 [Pseudoclavibacter alba]|uniref:phage tail protein n=1 Tax=Pseudoclavibacter albus TaxID=272241 RepID=UPI0019CF59B4|nr:hypothetical protein [Pseudoclavibacter alba]MBN6777436.1 hypothetical protein [Pseudoclavibacter alba]